jgi:alpha-glucosidase
MTEWWRNAVVYQVYPRSFADANGDGVGDLRGLISRLDYLQSLSIDAIWMSPCFTSPQRDHGYDVADYFDIDPMFGTLADLDELVAEAGRRDIKILLDIVPNHCSIDHTWFQTAIAAGRGSAERERFHFRDGSGSKGDEPPNNWLSLFGGPAWSRIAEPDGTPGQWYLHVFDAGQPDFNWEHPDVQQHFDDVLTFWLDRGVEGFRVDAVTVVGKTPGLPEGPTPPPGLPAAHASAMNRHFQRHDIARHYWARWRRTLDRYQAEHPGREPFTICEAYIPRKPQLILDYVAPDQFHQAFAFDLMLSPWVPGHVENFVHTFITDVVQQGGALAWTLNNHDTHRSVTRYGRADAAMAESWTGNNLVYTNTPVDQALGERRSRAMTVFAAGLPGAFFVYQGEELGLPEVLDMPDDRRQDPIFHRTHGNEKGRDGCRVPLPWTSNHAGNHGFSSGKISPGSSSGSTPGSTPDSWLPQPENWGEHSVETHDLDPDSITNMYRRLLSTRREIAVTGAGNFSWLETGHDDVLGYQRDHLAVFFNLGDEPRRLDVSGELLVESVRGAWRDNVLAPNSAVWVRL